MMKSQGTTRPTYSCHTQHSSSCHVSINFSLVPVSFPDQSQGCHGYQMKYLHIALCIVCIIICSGFFFFCIFNFCVLCCDSVIASYLFTNFWHITLRVFCDLHKKFVKLYTVFLFPHCHTSSHSCVIGLLR